MPASGDRFYLLELTHRPAVYGDLGNILKIEGLVVGGEGAQAVLMLPNTTYRATYGHLLTMEEWVDFLQRTDSPELMMPEKAFHRKVRYEISGAVQQKVWVADGLKCMYCNVAMGKSPMSIDHFEPLETGGANNTSNFLTACKKCNKDKGSMSPRDWCKLGYRVNHDYDYYVDYLLNRQLP